MISTLGFVIYGLFNFTCVTVLINTLIAMLEESIDKINDRADIEWKFARSKLYMEYIREGLNDASRTMMIEGVSSSFRQYISCAIESVTVAQIYPTLFPTDQNVSLKNEIH
jgi:hypothetical protein